MDFPARIKQQTCMDCLSGKSLGFEIAWHFNLSFIGPAVRLAVMKPLLEVPKVKGPRGCLRELTIATNTILIRFAG